VEDDISLGILLPLKRNCKLFADSFAGGIDGEYLGNNTAVFYLTEYVPEE
jgi:hypothetical protein